MVNYIVWIQDAGGSRKVECSTRAQVWKAIGTVALWGLFEVFSPTGKDCDEFVPL